MKRSLTLAALIALNVVACAPQSPDKQASKSDNSVTREHCMAQDKNASCFLEIEKNGTSNFYAPSRDYQALVTNPILADINVPMKEVSTEDYAAMVNKYNPTTVVYNANSSSQVDAFANTTLADSPQGAALNGWWSDFTRILTTGVKNTISDAVTGFSRGKEQGSAYPGAGKVIGAIGGTILGAIQGIVETVQSAKNSTNGTTQVNYHFGTQTIQDEASLPK